MRQPHPTAQANDAGFSLTEVLAAVFIVAVASSFILLSGPEQPDALTRQGQAVSTFLSTSADEAIIAGEIYGVAITQDGYQSLKWSEQTWQPLTGNIIPHESDVHLALDQSQQKLGISSSQPLLPSFTIDSTGFASGGPVTFEFGNDTLTLSMTSQGEIIQERTNEHRF